jgi:uncharacterized RDD family membrane protein YckC
VSGRSQEAAPDVRVAPAPTSASLGRRLGALLYEALLFVAMALVAGFAFLPLISPSLSSSTVPTVPPPFARTILFCGLASLAAFYCTWCWSEGRQTLPQKTWRIRIVGDDGRPIARKKALLRYFAAWIGPAAALGIYAALPATPLRRYALALAVFNYAFALVDRERRFLHDRVASTRIVRDV